MSTQSRCIAIVLGVFATSRVFCFVQGVRFDSSPLGQFWQIVDPRLLETRLVESLVTPSYRDSISSSVCTRSSGCFRRVTMHVVFAGLGATLAVALVLLLLDLGASPTVACLASSMLVVSPATILYEHLLFYEYPTVVMLCVAAVFLVRFAKHGGTASGVAFMLLVAAVVLTRSLFHPAWMIAVTIVLVGLRRRPAWQVLKCAAIPFLVVGLVFLKNLVLFGSVVPLGWVGANLAQMGLPLLPVEERRTLVERGVLTPFALVHPFSEPEAYRSLVSGDSRPTGIVVLDGPRLPSGAANLNHSVYVQADRYYLSDSLRIMAREPIGYARRVAGNLYRLFLPATEEFRRGRNREHLGPWTRFYNAILLGQVRGRDEQVPSDAAWAAVAPARALRVPWILVAVHAIGLIAGARAVRNALFRRALDPAPPVVAFLWVTIVYVLAVATLTSPAEQGRFRFLVDPFGFALAASVAGRGRERPSSAVAPETRESSTSDRDGRWPFVSVLISTKDRRADLFKALASLECQDYPRERFGVLVVEETDEPLAPPGVTYVPIPREGRGFGYTRAVALRHARAPIVAFIDDDCIADPAWLQQLVAPLAADPAILGVAGAVRVKDANTVGICENVLGFPGGGLAYLTRAGGRVVDTVHLSTCNCAYRTEVLGAVGGFPEVAPFSGEDYLVGRRVSRLGRCVYAPRAVVFHKPRGTLGAVLRWFVRRGRQEVWLLRHHPDVFELGVRDLIRTSLVVRITGALALGGLLGIPTLATLGALLLAYGVAQNVRYRFAWRYHRTAWLPVVLPATKLAMGVGGEVGRWIEALGWAREVGSKRTPAGARR